VGRGVGWDEKRPETRARKRKKNLSFFVTTCRL
jgi:hypothetical protein